MDKTILDQYHDSLMQAAINLDWGSYQDILRDYQGYYLDNNQDWDYPGGDMFLYHAVSQRADSAVAITNQTNLVRHLILNQVLLETDTIDSDKILIAACQSGNIAITKMLLSAGCSVNAEVVAKVLNSTDLKQSILNSILTNLALLIRQDQIDFSGILAGMLPEDTGHTYCIRWDIYRLDHPKLNRLVLIQGLDFTVFDNVNVIMNLFDNLTWTQSVNLSKMLVRILYE
jgi:hypothetical protein